MQHGERLNAYTHLVGAILALVGMSYLIIDSLHYHDRWKVVSVSIYGVALFLLYGTSTLYHALVGARKRLWQRFDHCAIYLLIAATYTPYTLLSLRGPWGWSLFGASWGLCLVGILQELWIGHRTRLFSLILYLVMGWMIVVAIGPLTEQIPPWGVYWLVAGGLIYSLGVIFYLLDERLRHAHGIWHLFVMGGSICHYISILRYLQ